jgi:hypothetical protein
MPTLLRNRVVASLAASDGLVVVILRRFWHPRFAADRGGISASWGIVVPETQKGLLMPTMTVGQGVSGALFGKNQRADCA